MLEYQMKEKELSNFKQGTLSQAKNWLLKNPVTASLISTAASQPVLEPVANFQ